MARKKTKTLPLKSIVIIAVAAVIIIALLVALAYSPLGQTVIDKIGVSDNNTNNDGTGAVKYVGIGDDITLSNGEVVLDNVVLSAHFVDVGQGDAIIVRLPDGKTAMIDGGSTSSGLASYKTELIAYLEAAGVARIEYLIVTHPDTDHYNMLTVVMDEYEVDNIYYNDCAKNTTYNNFRDRIIAEVGSTGGTAYAIDADGEDYSITGEQYSINIYAPGYDRFDDGNEKKYEAEESNGMSPIVVLECANRKLMLVGDATEQTEEWFIAKNGGSSLDVDFLKVGHHGSKTSTSQAFLDYITPEYCVIMADMGQAYGHPDATTMNKLFDMGVVTYRTNRQGDIVLEIDEDGDMAFVVEKEVPVENNTKGRNDLMIRTAA